MIFSVIVTYNPRLANVEKLVSSLKLSNVSPIVVDNGSESKGQFSCDTIFLEDNRGIAAAQNIGIERAINMGASKIIFFDQDSTLPDCQFISLLAKPIVEEKTLISAPIFVDKDRGFTYPIVDINTNGFRTKYHPSTKDANFSVTNVISSGTMVDVSIFNEVGMMKEELFIDYVDTEWCLRCANFGYTITVVPKAVMFHSIGDSSFSLLGFNIPKHSPLRRYYRVRNSFYLLRQNHIPKLVAIREVLFSVIHQLLLVLTSSGERGGYMKYLIEGLRDGVFGKFGKY